MNIKECFQAWKCTYWTHFWPLCKLTRCFHFSCQPKFVTWETLQDFYPVNTSISKKTSPRFKLCMFIPQKKRITVQRKERSNNTNIARIVFKSNFFPQLLRLILRKWNENMKNIQTPYNGNGLILNVKSNTWSVYTFKPPSFWSNTSCSVDTMKS